MRRATWTLTSFALLLLLAAAPVSRAIAEGDDDREEITITHSKLGPLSDWAQMQSHEAEYRRLKAKFDPSPNNPPVDVAASDRQLTAPPGQGERGYQQDLRNQPTAPAVKAVEDAVTP